MPPTSKRSRPPFSCLHGARAVRAGGALQCRAMVPRCVGRVMPRLRTLQAGQIRQVNGIAAQGDVPDDGASRGSRRCAGPHRRGSKYSLQYVDRSSEALLRHLTTQPRARANGLFWRLWQRLVVNSGKRKMSCMDASELLRGLQEALRAERHYGVQVLRFLAEVERREFYVERGFSSLFRFCVEALGLTEDQACRCVAVVRAALRVPEVFELLEAGELHMTGVALAVRRQAGAAEERPRGAAARGARLPMRRRAAPSSRRRRSGRSTHETAGGART